MRFRWRQIVLLLCITALLFVGGRPLAAAPIPKGVLGLTWDDSVNSVSSRASKLDWQRVSEKTSASDVLTVHYRGRVFERASDIYTSFYDNRLFDVSILFSGVSYDDFFVMRDAIEDKYGGAKRYHGSIGNFGAKECHWGQSETGISLIWNDNRSMLLQYTNLTKMNEALREWKKKTQDKRNRIKDQL